MTCFSSRSPSFLQHNKRGCPILAFFARVGGDTASSDGPAALWSCLQPHQSTDFTSSGNSKTSVHSPALQETVPRRKIFTGVSSGTFWLYFTLLAATTSFSPSFPLTNFVSSTVSPYAPPPPNNRKKSARPSCLPALFTFSVRSCSNSLRYFATNPSTLSSPPVIAANRPRVSASGLRALKARAYQRTAPSLSPLFSQICPMWSPSSPACPNSHAAKTYFFATSRCP